MEVFFKDLQYFGILARSTVKPKELKKMIFLFVGYFIGSRQINELLTDKTETIKRIFSFHFVSCTKRR